MSLIQSIVESSYIYIPLNCEAMLIVATIGEEGYFLGEGEESGESYHEAFSEVDLSEDLFYKLTLVEV